MPGRLPQRNYEDLVREGITAARTGRRSVARTLLGRASRLNPIDARPWLWLSETTDDQGEKRQYLERAVAADPFDAAARRKLALLTGRLDAGQVLPQGMGASPDPADGPARAEASVFLCPQCGGRLVFEPQANDLVCEYCGHSEMRLPSDQVVQAEQPLEFVLPTRKGHLWAAGQQRLACQRCGAVSLLPPEQRTHQCAYCGSNQLVISKDATGLIEPQGIGLFAIDAQTAARQVEAWWKLGTYTPADLPELASRLVLRPAYYPFWTFDGALEARWACEVRQGSRDSASWVATDGYEMKLFNDMLAPGLKAFKQGDLIALEPFALDRLEVPEDHHLANWTALGYDRSVADASLIARERVVAALRSELRSRVNPGGEVRNLRLAGTKWSGLSYKLVLLPVWVGSYAYKGEPHRVLVNGQTGKAGGEKPRDEVKFVMVWLAVGLAALVLAVLLVVILVAYAGGGL